MDAIDVRPFDKADRAAVIALWTACGLTRSWNDPDADIDRKLALDDGGFSVDDVVSMGKRLIDDGKPPER